MSGPAIMASAASSSSPFATQPRLSTLLGGTLESTLHELLYVRRIYPRDSFAPNRFLGVSCHASRHPGVVDYIYNFLEVAVPALCTGTADELALVVLDSPPGRPESIMERFVFNFDTRDMNTKMSEALDDTRDQDGRVADMVRYLEPRLRDVLLQVVSMNGMDVRRPSSSRDSGRKRPRDGSQTTTGDNGGSGGGGSSDPSGNMTFKLALRIAPAKDGEDEEEIQFPSPCAELDDAMKEAKWFQADADTCGFNGGPRPGMVPTEVTRTLKSVRAPSVGLNITLNMEIDPND
mmetsp:Transcript_36732/g.74850  ORF Transcript_36732/g.74850 Transcript_36732/m.74850 type:complete len:291 (-) Transcript_36732:686-1558(-)